MGLIKYNTRDYRSENFKHFVDKFFNDDFHGGSVYSFTPKVDVSESDKEFELQLHIPGVKKEEISIDLNENSVTISGERKFENEKEEKNFHSVESYYGSFSRSFYLPDMVNRNKVDATYTGGILSVKLPKDDNKVTRKQIAIK